MRNFTLSKINSFKTLFVLFFALLSLNVFAEGTPTLSPNAANITGLLSAPDITSGPYVGAPDDNRVKFYINNNATENFYFGFDARGYINTAPSPRLGANVVFYRIYSSAAPTVVVQQGVWNPAVGSVGTIDGHAAALVGPNIGGVTTGYNPFVFNPTADGEYFISVYRSSTADGNTPITTAAGRVFLGLFDFTVANNSGAFTKHNGRVYSDKWSFAAADAALVVDVNATASPTFHAYTDDQTIVKIEFNAGFKPIAFNVAVNKYGVTPGVWTTTRRSVYSASTPALSNGYKVFINVPDPVVFPVSGVPVNPTFLTPSVTGCGPYTIHYNVSEPGDVKLLLNLDGVAGYQSPGADRLLEDLDVLAGNNDISWDGLNGLGVAVAPGTNINLALTFQKGRFNLPLYDAEINKNGFDVSLVSPVSVPNAVMFWDDSTLTTLPAAAVATDCDNTAENANNITTGGINNSLVGTVSPARAWSGDGNPTQAVVAPSVPATAPNNETTGFQCDDFGNVRILNTWGWGYASNATNLNIVLGCADLSVTKVASSATPVVGTNITFTLTASNAGPAPSNPTVVNDLLPSGYTYQSDNSGGNYNSVTGNWNVGALASGANASIQIVATVNTTGSYANTATISGSQEDPTLTNNTSTVTPIPQPDFDGDGIGDTADLDDDNDGILDTAELCNSAKTLTWTNPSTGVYRYVDTTNDLSIRVTLSDYANFWDLGAGLFNANIDATCSNFSTRTGTAITGTNALTFLTGAGSGASTSANMTVEYFNAAGTTPRSLYNPILHVSGIGGTQPIGLQQRVTSSSWALQGGDTFTTVSSDPNFSTTGTTFVHGNLGNVNPTAMTNCATGENSGTIKINGYVSDYQFTATQLNYLGVPTNSAQTLDRLYFVFEYEPLCADADLDGYSNAVDLDSDGDGCSDSNEYYNNNTSAASGQQFGQTGGAVAPTNPNGTVNLPAATYTGSYANATNSAVSSACVVNVPPVADNDTATTPYDTNVNILASTGDTDTDGTINLASIDLDPTTPLTNDTTFTVPGEGTYTANADGTVTFDPLPTFSGTTTPVNYTIEDNNGANSNIATLTGTVANNPPVADNDT
ncbi:Ig-like domain-containing protein, partial [Flavobacterium sp.]|uniref:Ig-like domain-containing protein n=1 Tax=Flavobacterium sp. TaxID=239 RepID=UPI002623FE0E